MNQKIQFAFRAKSSANFSKLCREYGISTKTGYKWKARFENSGPEGLKEKSRRPRSSPEALSEEVVCRLVRIKESHRHWGARKVQAIYERSWGKAPSESSIKRVLERCGMVEKRRKQRAATSSGWLTSDLHVSAQRPMDGALQRLVEGGQRVQQSTDGARCAQSLHLIAASPGQGGYI